MECAGDHAVHRAVDDAQAQRERHAHQVRPPGQRRRKEVLHRQAQEIRSLDMRYLQDVSPQLLSVFI